MPKFLIRIEGVNIYNTVLDTNQLSVIRGSSLILLTAINDCYDYLTSHLNKELVELISRGASTGVFRCHCSAVQGEQLVDGLRKFLQQAAPGNRYQYMTFVVDGNEESDKFERDQEALLAMNRWQQLQQASLYVPPIGNSKCACIENHVLPAGPQGKLAPSTRARIQYGREQKQKIYRQLLGDDNELNLEEKSFCESFQALANADDKSNLNGKIAVIYCDGNKFSRLRQTYCKTSESLAEFDRTVQTYRKAMLRSILGMAHANPADWETPDAALRLETLLWGGDEFTFVVPAWLGWEVATHILDLMSDWKFIPPGHGHEGEPLRHAMGVIFCNHKAPIKRITDIVRDLAEMGKIEADSSLNFNKFNTLTYLTLESFDHTGLSLGEFLKGYLGQTNGEMAQYWTLCHRPEDNGNQTWRTLTELLQDIKGSIAKSQIYQLAKENAPLANQNHVAALAPWMSSQFMAKHLALLWDYLPGQEHTRGAI